MSDIFEEAKGTVPEAQPEPKGSESTPTNTTVEYKGKQWDADAIVNKFNNADSYIEQLKQENNLLQERLKQAATIDSLLNKKDDVQSQPKQQETTTPDALVDVEAIVKKALNESKQAEAKQANLAAALNNLTSKFGDKASEMLALKAKELDMTIDEAKELAMNKPKLFSSQFLGTSVQPKASLSSGSLNTQLLNTQQQPQKLKELRGADFTAEFNRRAAAYAQRGLS
jgi:hypothetical protein